MIQFKFPHFYLAAIFLLIVLISCKKEKSCEGCNTNDSPPVAEAGNDTTIYFPHDSILLDGTNSYDSVNQIKTYLWKQIQGPSATVINAPNKLQTQAHNFTKAGVYEFTLEITNDKGLHDIDTIRITLIDTTHSINLPPVAIAGSDKLVIFPINSVVLDGSSSYDPDNKIIAYKWELLSGTGNYNLQTPLSASTNLTDLSEGTYYFTLRVTDEGMISDTDTIQVTVQLFTGATVCMIPNAIKAGNLSQPHLDLISTEYKDKIYYASDSELEIFDPVTGIITDVLPLGQTRNSQRIIASDNQVMIAGGFTGTTNNYTPSDKVDIYSTITKTRTTANLSQPRGAVSVIEIAGKIFFAGGITTLPASKYSSRVDIYDIASKTWSQAEMPQAGIYAAIEVENKIWFVSTFSPSHNPYEITMYDPATRDWSSITLGFAIYDAPFVGFSSHENNIITLNNKIYFAGGQNVKVYDIPSKTWSTITLPTYRFGTKVGYSNNKIAFIGGLRNWFSYVVDIDIYDPATNKFTTMAMQHDLYYETITLYKNYIYSAGGVINNENNTLSTICKFSL